MSPSKVETEKPSITFDFPEDANTLEYAKAQDLKEPLRDLRGEYIIPSKANLKSTRLAKPGLSDEEGIYFCGNSLGLQPKAMAKYIEAQLDTWASVGVQGHFLTVEDSPLSSWQNMATSAARSMARLVGASPEEVVAMNTLTANLHLMMCSFYKPSGKKTKILMEWKAFPSDHVSLFHQ